MCRIINVTLALVLVSYSTLAAFTGIVSTEWWEGQYGNIGISTNCGSTSTATVLGRQWEYCSNVSTNSWENAWEKAMAGVLIGSMALGLLAIISLLINLLCYCCCHRYSGTTTKVFTFIQGVCLAGVALTMAAYYKMSFPPMMDSLAAAYYMVIGGAIASWIAVFLISFEIDSYAYSQESQEKLA
eukprot:CFRG3913T1